MKNPADGKENAAAVVTPRLAAVLQDAVNTKSGQQF
jgi:hypothetical protein